MNHGILPQKKNLIRDRGRTGPIEVIVIGGCEMERCGSIEPLGFVMAVLGSIRRPTNVKQVGHDWFTTHLDFLAHHR